MKDNLLEMLMSFFEQTLIQIRDRDSQQVEEQNDDKDIFPVNETVIKKAAEPFSTRVFTEDEKLKFTKASQQFLTRMMLWGVFAPEILEQVMTQLQFSESRFVTLQETKWAIRTILAEKLGLNELNFLDLVLYQKEDAFPIH